MSRPLAQDRDAILSSLEASTVHRAGEVAAFLRPKLEVASERAARAVEMSRDRAQQREARIRLAFGAMGNLPALDAGLWGVDRIVQNRILRNPDKYGPEPAPSLAIIRAVRQRMHAPTTPNEVNRSVPNSAPLGFTRTYARAIGSTSTST